MFTETTFREVPVKQVKPGLFDLKTYFKEHSPQINPDIESRIFAVSRDNPDLNANFKKIKTLIGNEMNSLQPFKKVEIVDMLLKDFLEPEVALFILVGNDKEKTAEHEQKYDTHARFIFIANHLVASQKHPNA